MLDPDSMAKLAQLKAELIAEEPKPEIIYPFKGAAKTSSDWNKIRDDFENNLNRFKSPPIKSSAPITNNPTKKHRHKRRHKSKHNSVAKVNAYVNDVSSSAFREKNRQMVASHANIARSYYSGGGNSLYTYSGGDVRPR